MAAVVGGVPLSEAAKIKSYHYKPDYADIRYRNGPDATISVVQSPSRSSASPSVSDDQLLSVMARLHVQKIVI